MLQLLELVPAVPFNNAVLMIQTRAVVLQASKTDYFPSYAY